MQQVGKSIIDQIGEENFAAVIKAHALEMTAWRKRELEVDEAGAAPLQPSPERYRTAHGYDQEALARDTNAWREKIATWPQRYKMPATEPIVMACVYFDSEKGEYLPGYEIVDDAPAIVEPEPVSDEELLARKKSALLMDLNRAEKAAIEKIQPAGKRRLLELKVADVRERDQKIMGKHNDLLREAIAALNEASAAAGGDPDNKDLRAAALAKEKDLQGLQAQVTQPDFLDKRRSAEDVEFMSQVAAVNEARRAIERRSAEAEAEIDDLTVDTVDGYQLPSLLE